MYITTMSLAYVCFGISIISLGFFLYFKLLVIKTGENKPNRKKIIGDMKNPVDWRIKNNRLSLISLFWSLLSVIAFIYLKFFYKAGLISIIYLMVFILTIAAVSYFSAVKRISAK